VREVGRENNPVARTLYPTAEGLPTALVACLAMPTLEELRDLAAASAEAGGRIVRTGGAGGSPRGATGDIESSDKGLPGDYVTEVDLASERTIREMLERATPTIPVLGEERGGALAERSWVVDPLDGTVNFIHGFWAVGVSVALVEEGAVVAGAVHAPFLGTTWTASRGGGAWRRERGEASEPIRVSDRPVERAVVGTGFPFRRKELVPRYLEAFQAAFEVFEDLRRPGAAALDLAWVADGTFDGFFELALGSWDVAAGAVLIEEAGGVVTDWTGGRGFLRGDILAGSPAVPAELLRITEQAGSVPQEGES
jgi:myo-inositol-1(or 4)-monophosphatase